MKMTRSILAALTALAILAGAGSAHAFFGINMQGTHLDGMRVGISGEAVGAVVLPTGTTVTLP
jgi:hypothetical protein